MNSPSQGQPDAATLQAWCRQAADGDAAALQKLLWAHHPRLAGFVRRKVGMDWRGRIDPEDILQEAYVDVFASIHAFTYEGEESFYRWAARIVDHRFIDQVRRLRRKKRDTARELTLDATSASRRESLLACCMPDTDTPSRVLRRADAMAALLTCIARLPEDYRIVVQRLYFNEEPLATVAAAMNRSEDAVRRLGSRALGRLRQCLRSASRYLSTRA